MSKTENKVNRTKKAIATNQGSSRSEESKQKMRDAYQKYRLENPEAFAARYKNRKVKTQEEKDLINAKRSASIKKWWSDNQDSECVKERNKNISKAGLGRVRTEASKDKQAITNTGKLQSRETKRKRAQTRENKAAKGESLGLKSKFYKVGDFMCQGNSEKKYIENLYANNLPLPLKRGSFVETPFGVYHPDFEFEDYFVEIKSEYTYKIYMGEINNIDGVLCTTQKQKLEWTSQNVKQVKLIIV